MNSTIAAERKIFRIIIYYCKTSRLNMKGLCTKVPFSKSIMSSGLKSMAAIQGFKMKMWAEAELLEPLIAIISRLHHISESPYAWKGEHMLFLYRLHAL